MMAGRTLYRMFLETVALHGDRPAVSFRAGKGAEATSWTYRRLHEEVHAFRRGLDALGLRKGDRLALLSHDNRVEWAIADLACQALGVVTAPIYGSLPAAQVAFYLADSGARAVVVSDPKQEEKVRAVRCDAPGIKTVITMSAAGAGETLSYQAVCDAGEHRGRCEAELDRILDELSSDDVATLIYTSGTTADPKGAMLTHENLLFTPDAVVEHRIADVRPEDVFLSFLPLSHITERVGGYYLPLRVGACIFYSRGLLALTEELTNSVRPTLMLCVPRLWETMRNRFESALEKMPARRQHVARWAIGVGVRMARARSAGRRSSLLLTLQHATAERLALRHIRERATGGRLRYCVSGGAPLDVPTLEFFLSIGIQMLEGYGLSETSIIAVNRPGRQRIGTVGTALPGVELRIADDGEILSRGPGLMRGYYHQVAATREAIDADGWFHTGDVGELSADGYLRITDRKKDILVLSSGKKVAPQPIEARLKHSPYISEAVLFTDGQSSVVALFAAAEEPLAKWAKQQGIEQAAAPELLSQPAAQKLYEQEVERLTEDLADFEKVRKFRVVPHAFTVEGGELTPTLKVRRRVIAEKYAALLSELRRR